MTAPSPLTDEQVAEWRERAEHDARWWGSAHAGHVNAERVLVLLSEVERLRALLDEHATPSDPPQDECRVVEVDGDPIRVQGSGDFTDEDMEHFREVIRAARRKFDEPAPASGIALAKAEQCALAEARARRVAETERDRLDGLAKEYHAKLSGYVEAHGPLLARVEAAEAEVERLRAVVAKSGTGAGASACPLVLRVPTDRDRVLSDGSRLNVGTDHVEVDVVVDPSIKPLGEHQPAYGRDTIRLREWNEQVLLHELLHVALSRSPWWHDPQRQVNDPHGHDVIARVEVALWETGWRWTGTGAQDEAGERP